MYVCMCNALRDRDVAAAAAAGARTAVDAYSALGAAPRCGRCLPFAQQLIDRSICGDEPALAAAGGD
jgi:bacterioferritin-associated ferredoxin